MTINTQLYRRLLKYSIPYWKMLALALIGMTITALTLSILPALIMQLMDSIFISKAQAQIKLISQAIIILFIVHGVANYIGIFAITGVGNKLSRDLQLAMFKKTLSLPEKTCVELTKKNPKTRFITYLNTLTRVGSEAIIILTKDSLIIIGLLAWMFYLNWELALLVLLITSAIILITQLINGHLSKIDRQTRQATKEVAKVVFDSLKNYQLIKLYGGQSHENARFKDKVNQMYTANMKQAKTKTLGVTLAQILIGIILIAIIHFMTHQSYRSEITPGEISSLIIAGLMLVLTLKRVSSINHHLLQGQQVLENIFSLLDREDEIDPGSTTIERGQGELIFDKVNFSGDPLIHPASINISLTINPGEIVVLSGMTENDKAAFINLILRFRDPTKGRIILDGYDLASLKLTSLHENIALIPQNAWLFDDTAASNIAYGMMKCASESKITAAAQAAHAIEFIREMPEGLQTVIGSHGVKLSRTQCQHIAIARALLKNPSLLILNELPTTHSKADNNLHEALNTLVKGRTTLIFTHHVPTLKKVDRIMLLKNGSIAEIENPANSK